VAGLRVMVDIPNKCKNLGKEQKERCINSVRSGKPLRAPGQRALGRMNKPIDIKLTNVTKPIEDFDRDDGWIKKQNATAQTSNGETIYLTFKGDDLNKYKAGDQLNVQDGWFKSYQWNYYLVKPTLQRK